MIPVQEGEWIEEMDSTKKNEERWDTISLRRHRWSWDERDRRLEGHWELAETTATTCSSPSYYYTRWETGWSGGWERGRG